MDLCLHILCIPLQHVAKLRDDFLLEKRNSIKNVNITGPVKFLSELLVRFVRHSFIFPIGWFAGNSCVIQSCMYTCRVKIVNCTRHILSRFPTKFLFTHNCISQSYLMSTQPWLLLFFTSFTINVIKGLYHCSHANG